MADFLSTGSPPRPATPYKTLLYLNGVTVSFDGFRALDGLSFYVEPGEMRVIIGPKGAGKATMMDVVTGRMKPDSGEVVFRGRVNLAQHDEGYIANLGIGRKFQQPTVFEQQSVFENLELAFNFAGLSHARCWSAAATKGRFWCSDPSTPRARRWPTRWCCTRQAAWWAGTNWPWKLTLARARRSC